MFDKRPVIVGGQIAYSGPVPTIEHPLSPYVHGSAFAERQRWGIRACCVDTTLRQVFDASARIDFTYNLSLSSFISAALDRESAASTSLSFK